MVHKSVLTKEVMGLLNPRANENFIDATLGEAGHAKEILSKVAPKGKVLGIELSKELYQKVLKLNIDRLVVINDSFANLKEIAKREGLERVSGILFDLGFSTWHLKESNKGFSFLKDELLDMRYNEDVGEVRAEIILNKFSQPEIENILRSYGEERFAGRISKMIIRERAIKPIETTFQLVEIIRKAVPKWYRYRRIHFATKTFQALRIAVNDELNNLQKTLPQAEQLLEKGGRLAIISFHSLEDRIVKQFFKQESKKGLLKILTKKPIKPTRTEIIDNPSSRSAKLRVSTKI